MRTIIITTITVLLTVSAFAADPPPSALRTIVALDNNTIVVVTSEPKGTVYTLIGIEDGKLKLKDMATVKVDAFGVASLESAREVINVRAK